MKNILSSWKHIKQLSLEAPYFPRNLLNALYLLVPQGVHEKIKWRNSHGIEATKEVAPLLGIGILGLEIDSSDWAAEQDDHSEVGGVGPKAFICPFAELILSSAGAMAQ